MNAKTIQQAFRERFGDDPPLIVRSPGRVNLIGEHTDYNDGFVLPATIDRAVWIAARPKGDARVLVRSLLYDEPADFDLANPAIARAGWPAYIAGVAAAYQAGGVAARGWEGIIGSDLPADGGLSSSAALTLAAARVFTELGGTQWQPFAAARLAQRVENEWVGVECGIMDPLASACGRPGHALLIDCRTREMEAVPLPPEVALLVLDTGVPRKLSETPYNRRRRECRMAAMLMGVRSLRNLEPARLEAGRAVLDDAIYRRARHVLAENERVHHCVAALRRGDAATFGRFMLASHESLRTDFEASSPELDAMVSCAARQPGCLGARMTGAGFGGCAVALVQAHVAETALEGAVRAYREATGREGRGWVCTAAEGTSRVGPQEDVG